MVKNEVTMWAMIKTLTFTQNEEALEDFEQSSIMNRFTFKKIIIITEDYY